MLYRLLTGPDDAGFRHKVSEALARGWRLHGAPTPAVGPDGARWCAQTVIEAVIEAVVKPVVKDGAYAPDMRLGEA